MDRSIKAYYGRYSGDDGMSIERQKEIVRNYAKHVGVKIIMEVIFDVEEPISRFFILGEQGHPDVIVMAAASQDGEIKVDHIVLEKSKIITKGLINNV